MKLSFVLPIYNEEKSIIEVFSQIQETIFLIQLKSNEYDNSECEIIAVNDCSKDDTLNLLNALRHKFSNLRIISHKENKGYGASLKTGISNAKGEFIAIMDIDGTYPIKELANMWPYAQEYEMVVGSRTGEHVKIPFARKPAKWMVNKLAEYVSGKKIPDLNSGLRIFKKDLTIRFWSLFPEGFSFTSTLTLACLTNGIDIKYVPINYYKRQGKSSIKPKHFAIFCSLMMRICLYFKPLKIFVPVALLFFAIGIARLIRDFIVVNYFGMGGAILIIAAIQFLFFGMLAELIIRRTNL